MGFRQDLGAGLYRDRKEDAVRPACIFSMSSLRYCLKHEFKPKLIFTLRYICNKIFRRSASRKDSNRPAYHPVRSILRTVTAPVHIKVKHPGNRLP